MKFRRSGALRRASQTLGSSDRRPSLRRESAARRNAPTRRLGGRLERLESRYAFDAALADALPRFGSYEALRDYLIQDGLERYDTYFGQSANGFCYGDCWNWRFDQATSGPQFTSQMLAAESSTSLVLSSDASPNFSTTNVQVAGVDEPDVIEVDDDYLYVLSGRRLSIIADFDPEPMTVQAQLELPGYAVAQFLYGDRLTVITSGGVWADSDTLEWSIERGVSIPRRFDFYQPTVTVTVYDVSVAFEPVVVEQTRLDGNYHDARAVGDKILLSLTNTRLELPEPARICESTEEETSGPNGSGSEDEGLLIPPPQLGDGLRPAIWIGGDAIWVPPYIHQSCTYETRDVWLARMEAEIDERILNSLPEYSAYDGEGRLIRSGLIHEAGDLVRPVGFEPAMLLSLVTLDVDDGDPGLLAAEGITSDWSSQVYATSDVVLIAQSRWWRADEPGGSTDLLMYRWDSETGAIRAVAHGSAPGMTLNQFALDYYQGDIRIATTTRGVTLDESSNHLFVLRQDGDALTTVGELRDFGATESIHSVRFLGERAFVVTFQQTDPLFAIDLSDPESPRIAGELKIPGFSGYLQMLDDHLLLGIGRGPDAEGDWTSQLSLFDVSDLSDPRRIALFSFDTDVFTQAQYDHRALTWHPTERLLMLPVSGWEQTVGSFGYPEWKSINELAMFRVDEQAAAPIDLIGTIEHDSNVRRGVWRGDKIYSISEYDVRSSWIGEPTEVLDDLVYRQQRDDEPILVFQPGFADPNVETRPSGEALDSGPTTPTPHDDEGLGELIDLARDVVARTKEVPASEVRLVTAESATWPDGCLGAAGPDEFCTSVIVEGYRLVLGVGDQLFLVHTNSEQTVRLVDDQFEFGEGEANDDQNDWQNVDEPLDVDGDGFVAPQDALIVINELNAGGARELRRQLPWRPIAALVDRLREGRFFWDVTGDRHISPNDALYIINRLNDQYALFGEGEAADDLAIGVGPTASDAAEFSTRTVSSTPVVARADASASAPFDACSIDSLDYATAVDHLFGADPVKESTDDGLNGPSNGLGER